MHQDSIEAVRHFNRFFTDKIGVLSDRLLERDFSLAEARVVYELGHCEGLSARDLADVLHLDPGYLSRLIAGLKKRGLLGSRASETDRRRQVLALTADGKAALADLEARSREDVGRFLTPLGQGDQAELVAALATVERLLGSEKDGTRSMAVIRPPRVGELTWVLARQAMFYEQEYGWGSGFELTLSKIGTQFLETFDPKDDCLWIADISGRPVGSAAVVRDGPETARLRIVYVEPEARGQQLGRRLVEECLQFARRQGYRDIVLSTYSILTSARRIYEAAGFSLYAEEAQEVYGQSLVEQHWRRNLT